MTARYPLEFIPNAKLPAIGGHPKNIIMRHGHGFKGFKKAEAHLRCLWRSPTRLQVDARSSHATWNAISLSLGRESARKSTLRPLTRPRSSFEESEEEAHGYK